MGRGPVFNGPGRSLVSATLSDRQTYITGNTCYMKYSASCKRQRVMHDDKYHHCNAMQKPCIIYCYLVLLNICAWIKSKSTLSGQFPKHQAYSSCSGKCWWQGDRGWKMETPQIDWTKMPEEPFTYFNLYGIHKAPNAPWCGCIDKSQSAGAVFNIS